MLVSVGSPCKKPCLLCRRWETSDTGDGDASALSKQIVVSSYTGQLVLPGTFPSKVKLRDGQEVRASGLRVWCERVHMTSLRTVLSPG